ncbi:hypothetical protein ACFL2M_00930, partial [Patescibacteria group bacterium]
MRYIIMTFSLVIIVLFGAISVFYYRFDPTLVTDNSTILVVLLLLLFPIMAAVLGVFIIGTHPAAFRYAPITTPEKEIDPTLHAALGLMIAVLQD